MRLKSPAQDVDLQIHPVTPTRWKDLQKLFGSSGADAGCWCMYFRMSAAAYSRSTNEKNRRALNRVVKEKHVPGLLGYVDGEPVGYIGLGKRSDFPRLERSRSLQPVDDKPVWSIVCFFISRQHRGQGVAHQLLRGAIGYVAKKGGRLLEAYPKDVSNQPASAAEAFTGVVSLYEAAGFKEVARRQPDARYRSRSIMRYELKSKDRPT